jgi:hypothetical protein
VRSSSVIMACGEGLFHYWELDAIMGDISGTSDISRFRQRGQRHEELLLEARGEPSYYLEMIREKRGARHFESSIWDLICGLTHHFCSDPRDRVFGLLSLADSKSRYTITADYSRSATAVLLQLIGYHAERDQGRESKSNFYFAHNIIRAFGYGPEIAAMRNRRCTFIHGEDPFPDAHTKATRDQRPQSIGENGSCSADRLPWRLVPNDRFNHVVLEAKSHFTVRENDAGEFVALLWRPETAYDGLRHDFSTQQDDTSDGIRIHMPDGSVVGLANRQMQQGDTVLLFDNGISLDVFHSALVVRRLDSAIAAIVGQCIVDSDVENCPGNFFGCVCGDVTHALEKVTWKVLMSPEDLLVFIAQDLKSVHRQPIKWEVPMVDDSVDLEESMERLTTRVTSEEFSSYAICES